jgi:hypothetical protein
MQASVESYKTSFIYRFGLRRRRCSTVLGKSAMQLLLSDRFITVSQDETRRNNRDEKRPGLRLAKNDDLRIPT